MNAPSIRMLFVCSLLSPLLSSLEFLFNVLLNNTMDTHHTHTHDILSPWAPVGLIVHTIMQSKLLNENFVELTFMFNVYVKVSVVY